MNQSPVYFFSGAALSLQQHGNVGPGNFPNDGVDREDNFRLAIDKASIRNELKRTIDFGSHWIPNAHSCNCLAKRLAPENREIAHNVNDYSCLTGASLLVGNASMASCPAGLPRSGKSLSLCEAEAPSRNPLVSSYSFRMNEFAWD